MPSDTHPARPQPGTWLLAIRHCWAVGDWLFKRWAPVGESQAAGGDRIQYLSPGAEKRRPNPATGPARAADPLHRTAAPGRRVGRQAHSSDSGNQQLVQLGQHVLAAGQGLPSSKPRCHRPRSVLEIQDQPLVLLGRPQRRSAGIRFRRSPGSSADLQTSTYAWWRGRRNHLDAQGGASRIRQASRRR